MRDYLEEGKPATSIFQQLTWEIIRAWSKEYYRNKSSGCGNR